jgi:hypothetical protein
MDFIITSDSEQVLDTWRRGLGPGLSVELWQSHPRDVPADAVAVSGVFAFERYGGRPAAGEARILRNHRDDGYPALVVVPASRPAAIGPDGRPVVRPEYAGISPAYFGMSRALAALREWNRAGQEPRVDILLMPLALLGMDDPEDTGTPASVGRALREAAA